MFLDQKEEMAKKRTKRHESHVPCETEREETQMAVEVGGGTVLLLMLGLVLYFEEQ